jgi:hypothetical protein
MAKRKPVVSRLAISVAAQDDVSQTSDQLALPGISGRNNFFQRIILGAPIEFLSNSRRIGNKRWNVTPTP